MAEMEAVNSFNSELSSLYEVKPPISKGKMTSITKAALKAVKLYKHVVQSVEKFIQKCKPEYKIPGLYVIDSIIRQSRHQFGPEKDVFAVRFARNLTNTFVHLYKCPDEDKAKVIRVLNLWQKNKIFMPEVIAPLFDLANPNHAIWETIGQQQSQDSAQTNTNNSNKNAAAVDFGQVHFKRELLEYDYDDDVEPGQNNDNREQSNKSHSSSQQAGGNSSQQSIADKIPPNVMNSFDALGSLLANPEVLRQLQTLQEQMAAAANQQVQSQFATPEQERQRKLAELNKQEAAFEQRLAQTVARLPFAVDCDFDQSGKPTDHHQMENKHDMHAQIQQQQQLQQQSQNMAHLFPPAFFQQLENNVQNLANAPQQGHGFEQQMKFGNLFGQPPPQLPPPPQQDMMNQGIFSQFNNYNQPGQPPFYEEKFDNEQERSRRRRSRSPVQGDRRHRSRSRSKTRRRSRSGSRGRTAGSRKKSYRSRSRERREEKEKEKERARKGFPPMKKEHVSVCSTTLWVGHLSKLVSQEEISDTFGVYGDIVSIDVIPPRGCAFIVMNRRQDALRALDRLKNSKLQGKTITLAWAPGKGVKGREWKDYWEVDNGVSYIPWNKLKMDTNIDEFEDGGCIDEDTLPIFLKNRPKINLPDPSTEQSTQQENDVKSGDTGEPQGVPPPHLTPGGLPIMHGTPTKADGMRNMGTAPKSADVDNRSDMSAAHAHAVNIANQAAVQGGNQIPLPVPVPNHSTGMVQPFVGMPPQVGMMGMPNYGMMVPPPLMHQGPGGAFGPPPGGMMGMLGATSGLMNTGPGGPMSAGGPGAGLLGDMPMVHQLVHQQQVGSGLDVSGNMSAGVGGMPPNMAGFRGGDQDGNKRVRGNNDEELPVRGVNSDQPGQKRKKSRFDDPSSPIDENRQQNQDLSGRNAKDDRVPLHERLKNIAEYGQMENARPSLLGNPQAPPPMMGNNVFNNGLPQMPLGDRPRPGFIPSLFNPVGDSPTANMPPQNRMPGNPNWFDIGNDTANPFVNPTNNPFVGNPFVQQSSATNPFDLNSSFEPLTNPNFNNDSPRGGGRGGWTGNRDGPPQGSPQKWGNNRGGGGGAAGGAGAGASGAPVPPGPNSWGRNESRREEGRFQENWRDNSRDHRGGHRDARDSRSGERDRDRGRDRERERSGRGDRRDSRDRSGGRDWRHDSRRGGRGNESGRDRSGRRGSGDRSDRGRSDRNENTSGRNRSSERETSQRNGETTECWDDPQPKDAQAHQQEQERSNSAEKEQQKDDDIQIILDTSECDPTSATVKETAPSDSVADAKYDDTQMEDTYKEDTHIEDARTEDIRNEETQLEHAHPDDTQMEDSEFNISSEANLEDQREETHLSQTDEYDDSKPSATVYEAEADEEAEVEEATDQVEAESQNQWNSNANDSEIESQQQDPSSCYDQSESRDEEPEDNFTANQNQDFSEDARQEPFEHSNEEAFNPEDTSDSRVSNHYDEEAERDLPTQNDYNPPDFNSHKETDDWSQSSAPAQHDESNENGNDEDSRRSFENNEEKHDKENYSEENDSNTKYTSFAPSYDNYSNDCGQNSNSGDYETADSKPYRRVSLSEEATNHKAEDNVNCESSYDNSYASAKNVQQDLDGIKDDQQSESNLHEIVTEEGTV